MLGRPATEAGYPLGGRALCGEHRLEVVAFLLIRPHGKAVRAHCVGLQGGEVEPARRLVTHRQVVWSGRVKAGVAVAVPHVERPWLKGNGGAGQGHPSQLRLRELGALEAGAHQGGRRAAVVGRCEIREGEIRADETRAVEAAAPRDPPRTS